jgi:exodeoxyribonuclease VII large subunit
VTAADPRQVLTPTALNRLVRQLLDDAMPPLWVEGELSNVARPASGHIYFTLKDAGAQVRCAMFRARAQGLGFRPADGLHVRVHGRVGLYEPRGDYQLVADQMEEAGEGALQRAFEQLKRRLAAEGLFEPARKRPLPAFPRRLAVITSATGAAVRDVLTVLARRFPLLPVDILPAPVQGAEAVPALRERLRAAIACGRYDVLLLTRGGGSLEDLWAFNDEQLARDIAASPIPVVAAIGHEVDTTLAELAADLRAPTPSAAAEAIAPDGAAIARQLGVHGRRLRGDTRRALQRLGQRLDIARLRLGRGDPRLRLAAVRERSGQALRRLRQGLLGLLERRRSRLAAARAALATRSPVARIAALRERLGHQQHRLCRGEQQGRRELRQRLAGLAAALQALSPLRTLDRGYAIVRDADSGRAIDRAAAVAGRALVRVELADGQVEVRPVADSLRLRDAD